VLRTSFDLQNEPDNFVPRFFSGSPDSRHAQDMANLMPGLEGISSFLLITFR
jgi:hypothetical protein